MLYGKNVISLGKKVVSYVQKAKSSVSYNKISSLTRTSEKNNGL